MIGITLALINRYLDSQVRYGLFSVMMASFSFLSDFSFVFDFPIIIPKMFKFWLFQLMEVSSAYNVVLLMRPCVLFSFRHKSEAFSKIRPQSYAL